MQQIILASNSPRRKELLSMLSVPFTVQESHVDERALEEADRKAGIRRTPAEQAAFMAEAKGKDVSRTAPANSIIIAADTMVADGDTILHKPKDKADAKAILTQLSGKSHMVYTGLCVIYKDAEGKETIHTQTIGTKVVFRSLTEEEMDAYIATGEPMDKAGAYGIQGKGSLLVERMEGDYFNVVGLPLAALYEELRTQGVSLMENWK